MKKKCLFIMLCIASILVIGVASAAASSDLEFSPSKVYFTENNTLMVEGNFYNTGTFISWLPKANVEITFTTDNGPKTISQSFTNLDLMINTQGVRNWNFELHDVSKIEFRSWKVKFSY